MAKKIAVPTATTKINEDVVYVDVTKLKAEVGNIETATKGINTTLKKISTLLKKAVTQKIVKGEKYKKIFTDAASHCNQQASGALSRLKGLKNKYDADVQQQEKNVLNGKIDELAKKVAKLQEQLNQTQATANEAANAGLFDAAGNTISSAAGAVADTASNVVEAGMDAGAAFVDGIMN